MIWRSGKNDRLWRSMKYLFFLIKVFPNYHEKKEVDVIVRGHDWFNNDHCVNAVCLCRSNIVVEMVLWPIKTLWTTKKPPQKHLPYSDPPKGERSFSALTKWQNICKDLTFTDRWVWVYTFSNKGKKNILRMNTYKLDYDMKQIDGIQI